MTEERIRFTPEQFEALPIGLQNFYGMAYRFRDYEGRWRVGTHDGKGGVKVRDPIIVVRAASRAFTGYRE